MWVDQVRVVGKVPGACEDAVAVTPDFVAVIDGVTSLGGTDAPGSGARAARAVQHAVASLPVDVDAYTAMRTLASTISEGAAVAALYSRHRHEIWRVGDIHVIRDGHVLPPSPGADRDNIAIQTRAHLMAALVADGMPEEQASQRARAAIEPILAQTRTGANSTYGVLLPGQAPPSDLVEVFPAGRRVVLCTDGYPVAHESLPTAETLLREVLREDPYRYRRWPETKGIPPGGVSFDDRAFVRVIAHD